MHIEIHFFRKILKTLSKLNEMDDSYSPYILNNTNILRYLKYNTTHPLPVIHNPTTTTAKTKTHVTNTNTNMFIPPNGSDSLFWCYYIITCGEIEYEMSCKTILFARQTKIQYVDIIRKNKSIVKMHKFDTLVNIENNLANDSAMNLSTMATLLAIHNVHVIIVMDKAYYELNATSAANATCYIIYKLTGKYGFELGTPDKIDNIYIKLYKMEHLHKPIKCISAYKVKDLFDIATRLDIEIIHQSTNKPKTKPEVYADIIQYF